MTDSWEEFNRKYDDNINSLRPLLNITIYGSYFPASEKKLLLSVKKLLIDVRYEKTVLVEDRIKKKGSDSLEISKRCLLYSDVNFLVFTKTGRRLGLVRELAFIAEDENMRLKIPNCMIFDQVVREKSSVPDLSNSDIKNSRMNCRRFVTNDELKKAIVNEAFWRLRSLAHVLYSRR